MVLEASSVVLYEYSQSTDTFSTPPTFSDGIDYPAP